ncbi:MAG: PH domain-containing protein [Nocardioides sp.]|nr:PH domain-containing protein [Nocardioides sp.]
MAYTQTYRSTGARVLAGAVVAVAAAGAASAAVEGGAVAAARWGGPLAFVAALAWLAYWRPMVQVDEHGVTIQNVLSRVVVPWPAVREVHCRYGLRVETPERSWSAWAAPSPVGMQRARGTETEASILVRQRLERVRALGELEHRTTHEETVVERDVTAAVLLTALAALAAVAVLLTA